MSNVISSSNFNETQKHKLAAMIAKIFRQQLISLNNTSLNDNDSDIDNDSNNQRPVSTIRSVENIEFFNFIYDNLIGGNFVIINADKHIFYRDVYVFCNRLKNFAKNFIDEQKVKELIFNCFHESSLM